MNSEDVDETKQLTVSLVNSEDVDETMYITMNNLRLGYTETTLLFFYYLDLQKIRNSEYVDSQNNLINWLCSTSGFYDKNICGSYFDFDANKIKNLDVYNNYFNRLLNIVKNSNTKLVFCFHQLHDSLIQYKEEFLNYIDYYNKNNRQTNLLQFMDNKNILIINNLGSLMKMQYESGNIKKISPHNPVTAKNIDFLEPGYTFFNSGHDSSILETAEKLCDKIKTINFDCAVVSAGAYSSLLFDYIVNELNKDVFVIGGDLPFYFGILTQRTRESPSDLINEYFINVPDEMKPLGYEKVENGCYW